MDPQTYVPTGPQALEDTDLEMAVQAWLVRISGLDGTLVRPMWQETPPAQPARGTNWMSFKRDVTQRSWDPWNQRLTNDDPRLSASKVTRVENGAWEVLVRGPQCHSIYNRISLAAGVDTFIANGTIRLVSIGDPVYLSAKVKESFLKRVRFEVLLRRTVSSAYTVPDLAGASISVMTYDVPNVEVVVNVEDDPA